MTNFKVGDRVRWGRDDGYHKVYYGIIEDLKYPASPRILFDRGDSLRVGSEFLYLVSGKTCICGSVLDGD